MRPANRPLTACIAGVLLGITWGSPVLADDSEIFSSAAFTSGKVRPNVLFVMDTSLSMDAIEDVYDPSVTYAAVGSCVKDRIYWQRGRSDTPPVCADNYVVDSANHCNASRNSLSQNGTYLGRFGQYRSNQWRTLAQGDSSSAIECSADEGRHGKNGTTNNTYPNNSTMWGGQNANNRVRLQNYDEYYLFTGNYINWYRGTGEGTRATRLEIVRDAAKDLTDKLKGSVNLGLMRYRNDAEGGYVVQPVQELTDTHQANIKASLDAFRPEGFTPLSETLYEAALYFAGMNMKYGDGSGSGTTNRSVPSSRVGGTYNSKQYKSPMEYSCQKNYIVYLTDGLPTRDNGANADIPKLDPPGDDSRGNKNDFATVMGRSSCDTIANPDPTQVGGECLRDLASYLYKADLNGEIFGVQNVTTYMIGFGDDVIASKNYLDQIAAAGGGSPTAYTASNASGLAATLNAIFQSIDEDKNVTFTAPTVPVDAFNRAQDTEDLYVAVFSPSQRLHWPGNLKKYKFKDGEIYGAAADGVSMGPLAVDPSSGFFAQDVRSFWSTETDGAEVEKGGAASRFPSYAESGQNARKLYTLGPVLPSRGTSLSTYPVVQNSVTDEQLGITADGPTRAEVVRFARGEDVRDVVPNSDNHRQMGDPMHARPAVVVYGGTPQQKDPADAVVFVPTNDGYLHAIDGKTGVERWAFIPPEFLPRQKERLLNPATDPRTYALDGDIRVLMFDADGDNIVSNENDRVFLFFGFGRGGSTYYALDVTNRDDPKFLWRNNEGTLTGLGKAWATPVVARMSISGVNQNSQKLVLIISGGYDPGQEEYDYRTDSVGNRMYIVDLLYGTVLWSAGPTGSGATLELAQMTHSIPAAPAVLDTDGDQFADRMYVGDMGGRIWRFDIRRDVSAANLVSAGVIASLGAAAAETPSRANNRRFYNTPDVALFSPRGARPYYNIAIGSGYRGHPLDEDTQDRIYAIRDYMTSGVLDQKTFDERTPILEKDLMVASKNPPDVVGDGAAGWMRELPGKGEKVLQRVNTVSGVMAFPTFQPNGFLEDAGTRSPCLPRTLNRAYFLRADNGQPYFEEPFQVLNQAGIAAEITVFRYMPPEPPDPPPNGDGETEPGDDDPPDTGNGGGDGDTGGGDGPTGPGNGGPGTGQPDEEPCQGDECKKELRDPDTVCLSGAEKLQRCINLGDAVRTYWQRN